MIDQSASGPRDGIQAPAHRHFGPSGNPCHEQDRMLPLLLRGAYHFAHLDHPLAERLAALDLLSRTKVPRKAIPIQFQAVHVIAVAHLSNQRQHVVADRLETVVQVLEIGAHDNVLGMLHPEPAVERGLARSRIMRVVHADAYPRADVPLSSITFRFCAQRRCVSRSLFGASPKKGWSLFLPASNPLPYTSQTLLS